MELKVTLHYMLTEEAAKRLIVESGAPVKVQNALTIPYTDDPMFFALEELQAGSAIRYLRTYRERYTSDLIAYHVSMSDLAYDAKANTDNEARYDHILSESEAAEIVRVAVQRWKGILPPEEAEMKRIGDAVQKERADREARKREEQQAERDAEDAAERDREEKKKIGIVAWVRDHGSEHLKDCLDRGFDIEEKAFEEYAIFNYPGWGTDFYDRISADRIDGCPSEATMRIYKEVEKNADVVPGSLRVLWNETLHDQYECEIVPEGEAVWMRILPFRRWIFKHAEE